MANKLLASLGLTPPRAAASAATRPAPAAPSSSATTPAPTTLGMRPEEGPAAARKPYDLNLPPGLRLPPGYDPDDPKNKQPDEPKLPADPQKQIDLLADAIAKTQDAVKRDKLVRALRDVVAKIQPVMSDKDAKKQIDKAIDSLIESGSKKLLLGLITAVVGKGPSQAPDPDAPHPVGPAMKEKDLGEHILKSPEIPFGKAPAVRRNSFEFRGLPKAAKPSAYVDFKLLTPDWFDPGKTPGSWVIVMEADDFKKNRQSAHDLHSVHIIAKGTLSLSVAMPDDPGHYVLAIKIQADFEDDPVEAIEVGK
jgi:hypothetical protein